ncbi:Ion transport protein-domain-containing protein [Fennellomyces sp. T-0311]|nr:Ion transport protein-domain-containing protein [Fennellomyces sp. T-0311]
MPDPEDEPKSPNGGDQNQQKPASQLVPQITLTEANDNQSRPSSSTEQPQSSSTTAVDQSPNSLSPKINRPNNIASPPPLPLTRDLLQRKNKLDKLIHDGKKRSNHSQSPPIMTFAADSNIAVDERVTAGLGISTPSTGIDGNTPHNTNHLRHRRHSARPSLMTSAAAIMDGDRTHRKSPPPSPQTNEHFKWNYDFDFNNLSSNSASVREPMVIYSGVSSGATSHTASSAYNTPTKGKKVSPADHYDEKHYPSPPSSLPPPYSQYSPPLNPTDLIYRRRTSHKILKHIFDAATQVVNLRGCERVDKLLEDDEIIRAIPLRRYRTVQRDEEYDAVSAKQYTIRPSEVSSPMEKLSTHSRSGSVFAESISRLDKKSLFSDLPSATRHDSRNTATETMDQQSLPPGPKNMPRFPYSPLAGNSLCVLPPDSHIRYSIWKNVICSRYVETFLMVVILLHYFLLICVPIYENPQKTTFGGQWNHYPILCIQCIYTIEALCKIIVYGFWVPPDEAQRQSWIYRIIRSFSRRITTPSDKATDDAASGDYGKRKKFSHRAYFSGFANTIDLIAIVAYWVDLGLMVHEYRFCSLFKALSAMRPLRLLCIFRGTATIMRSLLVSWDMLKDVVGFVLFFLLLFALIGLVSFKGVFSRRCFAVNASGEQIIVDPPQYCSGYYNGSDVLGAYNVHTGVHSYPGYNGYICTNNQICLEDPSNNPDYGFANYDTIYFALLAVYTSASLELWTELMYINQDADSDVAALFYCLLVYVVSFLLIFLIFAVITSGFSRVRAANRVSAFTGKRKSTRMLRSVQAEDDQGELIWQYDDPEYPDQRGTGTRLRLKRLVVKMVKSPKFFYFGEDTLEMLDNAETAFTFLFAFEIVLRMVGAPGWMQFWASGRNKFDLFLVIVTCVIQLPMIQDSYSYKYLTIFQCLRQYRLFICIPRVRKLLSAALGTGESVIYVVVFLLLCTALCSPIFMQLFGGDFSFIGQDESELRCDTFWESYLTLIMLYTSETWTDFLYNAMESQPHFSAFYAAIITSDVMSGLYIAVILENFELEDEEIKQYQIRQFIQRRVSKGDDQLQSLINRTLGSLYVKSDKSMVQIPRLPTGLTATMDRSALIELLIGHQESINEDKESFPSKQKKSSGFFSKLSSKLFKRWRKGKQENTEEKSESQRTDDPLFDDEATYDYERVVEEENRRAKEADMPTLKSLFVFSTRNRIRRWCKLLAGSTADGRTERRNLFNWFIMACVLASILLVILDEPSTRQMRQDTYAESAAQAVDIGLGIVFVVEIVIRIIADGFLLPPNAYLRNSWNRLDFVVVALNFGAIFAGTGDFARALSTVRSLRVLRLIRYFSGVRDVFVDLFHAFPYMMDALLLVFLVMIFFSIYGVNILGGRMIACNDDQVSGRAECVGEFLNDVGNDGPIEILQPRVWVVPEGELFSYDDFPIALAHLFSLSSTEGWIDSLFMAMSAPKDADVQPEFDWTSSSVYHSIYYIVFMVISHGTLQLFVGVIIEKFKQRSGITTMTTGQRQYADLRRQLAEIKPTPKAQRPKSRIRSLCYNLVANKRGPFNKLIMAVVILNICIIATEFQNEPTWLTNLQDYMYLAFCVIYMSEVVIKYLGLGWAKWSKSKWNWYDAFIAVSALILTVCRFASPDLWTLRIERYCLVLAAFRLGEGIDSLQTLYHTVRLSLPAIVRVTAVFVLVMCLFAMVFMELFGLTKYGLETGPHSNFRDYGNALLLLVRITTGEAWNIVMMDNTVQAPNCVYSDDYLYTDCGSPGWAYFLFNVYYLICTHIFLNLFTATIISNFEYAYETRSRFTRLTKDDLRNFKYAWSVVDPSGSGYIQRKDVTKFLRLLGGRLRLSIYDDAHSIKKLQALSAKRMSALSPMPDRLVEKSSGYMSATDIAAKLSYNLQEVNKSLSKIDPDVLRERRREYNLYYLEILDAETSKGISFEDVRTIMSYRFVDIEDALTIDPLIKRLEKLDQLNKAYATEKARGVFLMMAQRKRYLHDLWQKKNEDEMRKLGINNRSGLQLDTSAATLSPKSPLSAEKWRRKSPVPTIIIQDAPPSPRPISDYIPSPASLTVPVSPMSNYSFETQYGSPIMTGGESLNVAVGTVSPQASPFSNSDQEDSILHHGALSPNTPYSPTIMRQNWRVIDGNSNMSSELAEFLMDSLHRSQWSDMLSDEK